MTHALSADDADLRAIRALNERDVRAVLANDFAAVTAQWSDDFTVLSAGTPILRGRAANAEQVERARAVLDNTEPLEYVTTFEEITVTGGYAFEWGTFRSVARSKSDGAIVSYGGKLMRILQRQPDGAWKMHRTMMTLEPVTD